MSVQGLFTAAAAIDTSQLTRDYEDEIVSKYLSRIKRNRINQAKSDCRKWLDEAMRIGDDSKIRLWLNVHTALLSMLDKEDPV